MDRVRDRSARATAALEAAGVPNAVVGGNAVAAWVATIDPEAARNTKGVDILFRRGDLDAADRTLTAHGFIRYQTMGVEMFLDGPDARPRGAVPVLTANEKVKPADLAPTPDVDQSVHSGHFGLIDLESIVRMKLTCYRDKDKTHLRDVLDVGLIDSTWPSRFPPDLAARLQLLIDTPGG